MDGRDVTLNIKVKDAEVKEATGSLNRLKKAADDVGTSNSKTLTQQEKLAQFMGKDVVTANSKAAEAISGVETASTEAAAGMSGMAIAGGIAVAALAAIVVAGVAVVAVAFKMASGFAEYTMEIGKATLATGLHTETVSALTHEGEKFGVTFNQIEGIVSEFRKTLGQAAAGSVDAKAKLTLLGIDGSKAIRDVDGAFKSAIATIVKLPPGLEQARAAYAAFGEDGYKLIPFFQSFNGNVDEAIKKTTELGILLSGKDVEGARQFTANFEDAKAAVHGLWLTFGREFLPTITQGLKDFTHLLVENKDTIIGWAKWWGDSLKSVYDWWVKNYGAAKAYGEIVASQQIDAAHPFAPRTAPLSNAPLNTLGQDFGLKPSPVTSAVTPIDPAVLEAMRAQADKLKKDREDAAKAELSAQISLYEQSASQIGKAYDNAFSKITDTFKETLDTGQYQAAWDQLKQWYGAQINELVPKWTELVKQQTLAEKKGAMESELIKRTLEEKQQALTDKTLQHDDAAAKAVRDVQNRLNAEELAEREATVRKSIQLDDTRLQHYIENQDYRFQHGMISEREYLDLVNRAEVANLEQQKKRIESLLDLGGFSAKKRAELEGNLALVQDAITQAQLHATRAETEEERQRVAVLKEIGDIQRSNGDAELTRLRREDAANRDKADLLRQIQQMNDQIANGGVNDSLIIQAAHLRDILELRNRELDAVIRINRAQLELAHAADISNNQIRAGIYEHLAAEKTLNQSIVDGFNSTYDALTKIIDGPLDKLNQKAKGLLGFVTEPLKFFLNQRISSVFSNIVDKIFPGDSPLKDALKSTGNPVLDESKKQTTLLQQISINTGRGVPGGIASTGGGLGGILAGIFGGGGFGSGGGVGGTPNFGQSAGAGSHDVLHDLLGGGAIGGGSSGGGLLGSLKSIFSTGPGGIFAPQVNPITGNMNSKLAGYLGGGGSILSLVGGIIGGNAGSVMSSIGTGLQIGSMFGVVGAGIGAAIGAIVGLFGISKKRREEEKIRNQGMLDAWSSINEQFDALIGDIRFGGDPSNAITRGTAIGEQVRAQYLQMANSLTDKKTRNHALQDVSRVDSAIAAKMAELRQVAGLASASADRAKRILPEFAGGTYFADYFRPNGLIPGVFDSRDDMLAMLSRGEMVLNPMQQNNVRRAAGFDVFGTAGIPNYPRANPSPAMATGGIAAGSSGGGSIVVQPHFTLELSGVSLDDKVEAFLTSDDGMRTQIKVNKKLKKTGDI